MILDGAPCRIRTCSRRGEAEGRHERKTAGREPATSGARFRSRFATGSPGELSIFRPDVVVTQGRQAAKVMEVGFPLLEEVGSGECQMRIVLCAERRTLWIHTHHPNAYGLFHQQRKRCGPHFADAVDGFMKGQSPHATSTAVKPAVRVLGATPPPARDDTPRTIDQLIEAARRQVRSEASLNQFVAALKSSLPGSRQQHVGLLSGMRVQQFQNWLMDNNAKWQLTDAQLLAVMRVEFPLATGQIHVGDVATGLKQVAGIRAHYNGDGHNGPSPISRGLPDSVSYGRF